MQIQQLLNTEYRLYNFKLFFLHSKEIIIIYIKVLYIYITN